MHKLSNKCVVINFSNEAGNVIALKYQLFETSLLPKWWTLMQSAVISTKVEGNGHFYGKIFNDEKFLESRLNFCIERINTELERHGLTDRIIKMKAIIPMSIQFLNDLHYQFEILEPDQAVKSLPGVYQHLIELNIRIHQAERFCYEGTDIEHVQVLLDPPLKAPLADEDYSLFDTDYEFGTMYLTYGMTGVPTKDAFIHQSQPTPQNVYSSGMYLCFFEDRNFKQHEEFKVWLSKQGMDPSDPKLALGYIPLGKLINSPTENKEELLKLLAQHQIVQNVKLEVIEVEKSQEVEKNEVVPRWPFDAEVMYHLDYCPYIDLKIDFNAKELLAEAQKAIEYFVVHREYDQSTGQDGGRWKSLGLRSLFGDYTKTQYHTSYEFSGDAIYKQTVFAELCPKTMQFLNTITDVNECERVRFMLLEPGAKIKVHRDSQTRDVCLAVNISLNMPEGCEFFAGMNADGTKNEFTKKLPFKDSGSVLLFNNAKYHTVHNNSDTPRIHIIFHGPIRIHDDRLLELAREQNTLFSRKELLKTLVKKKAQIGEPFEKSPYLLNDWLDSGLDLQSIPDNIQLCVWDHSFYESTAKKSSLNLITLASLFPLKIKCIREEEMQLAIDQASSENKTHIVFIAAGTLIENINQWIVQLIRFCNSMSEEKHLVAGQILDKISKGQLPYFHEQFLIINLAEWNLFPAPDLRELFSKKEMQFPAYSRSPEHFHDDYTPHWISHGNEIPARKGFENWGTMLMAALIMTGRRIVNIPAEIRNQKSYAYPRDNNVKAWMEVQARILRRLEFSKEEVYVFNNENLSIAYFENIKPDTLITVCAGFKPFKIIDLYNIPSNAKIHFWDFSAKSVQFFSELPTKLTFDSLLDYCAYFAKPKHGEKAYEVCRHHLNSIVRDYFQNDFEKLKRTLMTAAKAEVKAANLIENTNALADALNSESRFVIWISNVFYNNSLYFLLTKEQAEDKFLQTVNAIAEKTKTNAFRKKGTNTIVFGENLTLPIGLITDGGEQSSSLNEKEWERLFV